MMHDAFAQLKGMECDLSGIRSPGLCFDRTRYFFHALSESTGVPIVVKPVSGKLFTWMRLNNIRGTYKLWERWADITGKASLDTTTNHIARFKFKFGDGGGVRVAIDIADGRHLHNQEVLDWSDIYFKCNAWPGISYPDKVLPLPNGNGTLNRTKINYLKSLRSAPKKHDLVYWSRVWAAPGNDQQNNGVEHNIRLFEALAGVRGNNNLLAVFPDEMSSQALQGYRERLDRVGVPWQQGWGGISSQTLWKALASARINFLRPGNHLCISWRMMDLLAMGACIMVDGSPQPQWPEPLRDGINFADAGCTLSSDYRLPDDIDYLKLADRVSALIGNEEKVRALAANNARYFDKHADMPAISAYILSQVSQYYQGNLSKLRLAPRRL